MQTAILFLAFVMTLCTVSHLVSIACVSARLARRRRTVGGPLPPVSMIVPVCGMENNLRATLGSMFQVDIPEFEILFCIASPDDQAIAVVRELIDAHPQVQARLLIGNDNATPNPKLNTMLRGWPAARHDWVMACDSNVLLPRDAAQQMFAAWDGRTGLVCSPPVGAGAIGFAGALEAAFLDTYQARWQLMADEIGNGFAQGKAMLISRPLMERFGGLAALAAEPGEDGAATKILRRHGLNVRLVASPFVQPLGQRRFADVWRRQLRWARLRRATFPPLYFPELLAGMLPPLLALMALVAMGAADAEWLMVLPVVWYAAEAVLARIAGWPLSWLSPVVWLTRDCLLPALWLAGWGRSFVWRGNAMGTTPTAVATTVSLSR